MADLPVAPLMPGWQTLLTLIALATAIVALGIAAMTTRRQRRLAREYAELMTGADGTDLSAALLALTRRTGDAERRLTSLEAVARAADDRLRGAVQHVRVLRYSAFADAGGDQSFAVAMLDDAGSGVVMSSLVSRTGARVFAKPVIEGRSTYPMTTEEERVVAEASAGAPSG